MSDHDRPERAITMGRNHQVIRFEPNSALDSTRIQPARRAGGIGLGPVIRAGVSRGLRPLGTEG